MVSSASKPTGGAPENVVGMPMIFSGRRRPAVAWPTFRYILPLMRSASYLVSAVAALALFVSACSGASSDVSANPETDEDEVTSRAKVSELSLTLYDAAVDKFPQVVSYKLKGS